MWPTCSEALSAAGIAELLRNPVYNGYLVRYRGFADEERVEAPWRRTGDDGVVDPPVPDEVWERVQAIRQERSTPGVKSVKERIYPPRLACHGCGAAMYGHARNGSRRMVHPDPVCASWSQAAGDRLSFRAEVYEWQIAALLATAKLDEAAKRRVVESILGTTAPLDTRRIGRLEQELRTLALDNAFGRVGDEDYLRRKASLAKELEDARRPAFSAGMVDPHRAMAWIDDLRSLWEAELPDSLLHAATRRDFEQRRAEATATAFERLEVLGPVIVEAKVAEDLLAGRALIEAIAPERAVLLGDKAGVMAQLTGGRRSRLVRSDTAEARKKRRQRSGGTLRCNGRGERLCAETKYEPPITAWNAPTGCAPGLSRVGTSRSPRLLTRSPSTLERSAIAPQATADLDPGRLGVPPLLQEGRIVA